jgi:hypothetical protein
MPPQPRLDFDEAQYRYFSKATDILILEEDGKWTKLQAKWVRLPKKSEAIKPEKKIEIKTG